MLILFDNIPSSNEIKVPSDEVKLFAEISTSLIAVLNLMLPKIQFLEKRNFLALLIIMPSIKLLDSSSPEIK